jgi:N,N'-diacetylchitobiose transport system permease protein
VTQRALPRRVGSRRRPVSKRARKIGLNLLGLLVALITLFPIFFMVSTSFKPSGEIETLNPHLLPSHPTLANYRAVLDGTAAGIPYWDFLRNSLFVTIAAVVLSSLIALMAAIAVARFRFRLRTTYLIMLLIVQMLPQQALVIALFLDYKSWFNGYFLDNLVGLIIVYTAFALPVTIWMLRNFVAAVPKEMEEAAAIDGAGPYKVFFKVLLPLVTPGLVATSVFAFIFAYNEFVFALTFLLTDESKFTLPLSVQYLYSRNGADWGAIMASSTLFTIPVMAFFLLVRGRMASGLVAGAVKG